MFGRSIPAGTFALALGLAMGIAAAAPLSAGERVEHYEAAQAETLEQAVANFSEYNAKLSEVLAQPDLTANDLEAVHELTYTLEDALAKIRGDLAGLAETLEALHLASEAHEAEAAERHGADYLATARTLVP